MTEVARPEEPRLMVSLQVDPPGVYDFSGRPSPVVVIHVGPSVHIACQRDGRRHSGLSVHGDVDIVPAGVASRWEIRQKDTALVLGLPERLLRMAANQIDVDPKQVELVNRFQVRDRQIEHIGWALKTEMEAGYPNGTLYLDSLATALSLHLLHFHSSVSRKTSNTPGGMAGHRLKQTISYIEDNLARNLSLDEIARNAGLSVSHCKAAFRNSVGQPIHQYVIQRRVDRAKTLLLGGELSISQVALETGFAHQSHLAYHMRRVLGVTPKSIQDGAGH
ncbi:MAG TPA: AraC family transcriptional regulator [Bryobacteraceae bacterium]|nr:AraC family transcriptional regulator [Bryobacteraceae bacterium]